MLPPAGTGTWRTSRPVQLIRNTSPVLSKAMCRTRACTRQETRQHFGVVRGRAGTGPLLSFPLRTAHTPCPQLENNGGNLHEPHCQPAPRLRDKARCVRVTHRQLSAQARLATAELHLLIITSLAPRMFTFFPQLLNKLISS